MTSIAYRAARAAKRLFATLPGDRQCCVCHRRVRRFLPYRGGWRTAPPLMKALKVVGSDLDNFECPRCGATDRERHLMLYLKGSTFVTRLHQGHVLHFAPERHFARFVKSCGPARYVKADLFPTAPDIERLDMTAIAYADESFDVVIANHVLEHVFPLDLALAEIRRVLKPGGFALLQTPFSETLTSTFEDSGILAEDARLHAYGQEDHVRLFGSNIADVFCASGLRSRVIRHEQVLSANDAVRHGVNAAEPLLLFERE